MKSPSGYEELLDYRRSVAEMYARHPQSPLREEETRFKGLDYFDYDAGLRYVLSVEYDVEPEKLEIQLREDGLLRIRRFGRIRLTGALEGSSLSLFWIEGYGGGIFLPFKDATGDRETYGGGRYLLDTIKHADLGQEGGRMVIDFNYAYNPSCAYSPEWVCPLAPPENILPVRIRAGERAYDHETAS